MSVSYLVWLMFCQPGLKDTLSQGLQAIRYWTSFLPPSDTGGIQDSVMELWVISSATKFLGLEGGSEKLNEIQSTHVKINLRKTICSMYFKLININWVHWKKCLKLVDSYEGYKAQWLRTKDALCWHENSMVKLRSLKNQFFFTGLPPLTCLKTTGV